MNPEYWGPHAWIFLHCITLAYPECPSSEDKKNIKDFFMNLCKVLPCDKCKNNFQDHLKKFPLSDEVLCSKKKLVVWLINIHNSVNQMNGKPKMDEEEVIRDMLGNNKIESFTSFSQNKNLVRVSIIIVVLITFLSLFFYLFSDSIRSLLNKG